MSRFAITRSCSDCGHSAVDDVELDAFVEAPDARALERERRKCSCCGSRRFTAKVEKLLPAWTDSFRGGLKLKLRGKRRD